MKRLSVLVVAALAAIVLSGVLTTSGGAQQPGERTLTFVAVTSTEGFVDLAPKVRNRRLSAGDMFITSQRLLDAAGKRVGTLYVKCTAIHRGRDPVFQCEGTYAISGGTVVVSAAFGGRLGNNITGAIVGGTGDYEGAAGTLRSRELPRGRAEDTLHLVP
jgi:hypothetical protein